MNLYIVIKHNT